MDPSFLLWSPTPAPTESVIAVLNPFGAESRDPCPPLSPPPLSHFRMTVDVYIAGVVSILGIIGNVLSFIVLGKMASSTTTLLLRALSVTDSLYLIACAFFQVFKTLHIYCEDFRSSWETFCYTDQWVWPLASIAQTCSVWLVVMVTADRYFGITRPLLAKRYATTTRGACAVVVVVFSAVLFNIPTFLDLEVITTVLPCSNSTKMEAVATPLAWSPLYQLLYKTLCCSLFRTLLPLLLVIYFNSHIVRSVNLSKKQSRDLRRHAPTTSTCLHRLVIGVVIIFVVCETPDLIYRLLRTIKFYAPQAKLDWKYLTYLAFLSNLLLTVNSAFNFVMYCVAGKMFRRHLQAALSGVCCRKHSANSPAVSKSESTTTKTERITSDM